MSRLLIIALLCASCSFSQSYESPATYVRTTVVTLSPANLRALSSTQAFTILAGVAGKTIVPISVYFRYTYGTSPYSVTEDAIPNAYFYLAAANNDSKGGGASSTYLDYFFLGTDSADRQGVLSEYYAAPPAAGQSFKLFLCGGSDITDGDGTLTVMLAYTLI